MSVDTPVVSSVVTRRLADFHPSVWGDHFIQYALEPLEVDEIMMEHITVLKERVRKMLVATNEMAISPFTIASLIDSLQRLGLSYHFEHEIGQVLQYIYNNFVGNVKLISNENLRYVALVFRLLRQQGYHISSDVFNKFKDEQGNFNKNLIDDVEGMLSLYEATHLRIHGEDILEEALVFTSTHLMLISNHLSSSLHVKVKNCLKQPLHKNLPRLVARNYISTYEEDPSHDETLLLFAKLDFNKLQKQHQNEVGHISRWWKILDFATKLPFARNRMVETYFWALGVYFEPQYSLARTIFTKVVCLISVVDDIYDAYGTLEELQLFTEAIERWDIKCMDFLPEYMKVCFKPLLDVYEEIEQKMIKEGRAFCINYAKNEIKRLVHAYFAEVKWLNNNYIATFEEYMQIALESCGYRMLTLVAFIGMGSIVNEKALQWVANDPKIVKASTIICRLMDDIVSNDFEQKRGHVVSAIECYMKQHGVTKQDAINEFLRLVTSAWKDINEEFLDAAEVPKSLLMRVLNLSRVMDVLYKDKDCYTHSEGSTKDLIKDILLNPWPVKE